jgi:glycosyltransferase involved in cell wall biosynthesis
MRAVGWEVHPFIVGDRIAARFSSGGSEERLVRGTAPRIAADLMRLAMGQINSRRAWREMQGRVDWVYERFAVFQALGRRAQRHGIPWILETNGIIFSEAKIERKTIAWSWLARRLEVSAYRDCDVLVTVTATLKEAVTMEADVPAGKIVVVPNGVDPDVFDPGRHQPRRLFDGLVLGFVGTLFEWQGLDPLIGVLAELKVEGIDLSLVVVGDGAVRGALEAKTHTLGLSSSVRFVGRVPFDEVPSYIAGFDLGYTGQLPLQLGGMYHSPLKLYEYMAMAKPVVAASYDDARQVVREGVTGFLFAPANAADLKRALRHAYDSREHLPRLGERARELMVAEHTWLARVQRMIPEIERVLRKRE